MSKKLILSILFYCGFLSAAEFGHIDMELMLIESSMLFESRPLSELNFHNDKHEDIYYFSFCRSDKQHWLAVPLGKSTGYRINRGINRGINQGNQQPELVNCKQAISPKEFDDLLHYVHVTEAKKSQWTVEGRQLCYSKKNSNNITRICHPAPRDYAVYGFGSIANWVYRFGAWAFAGALALTTAGVVSVLFVSVLHEYTKTSPVPHRLKSTRRARKRVRVLCE